MCRLLLVPLAALATAALLGRTPASTGQQVRVVSIGDGDTIGVQQGSRRLTIRLACIDAPEMAQRPYGPKAREYLRLRLPIGRSVTLKIQTTDRYGRTVAEVFSDINVNLALVEDGQAFAYRKYLAKCDAREYLRAEERARRSRFGVWRVPGGIIRPWDFRSGRRSSVRPDGVRTP